MAEFPSDFTCYQHRVSYGETDAMGVLYYAEYIHIFERARSEHIRNHGMSYNVVEERGILLPVRKVDCRYRHPARFDDLLQVNVAIDKMRKASIHFVYEIYNETKDTLLATGSTEHACVNKAGRPVGAPQWLKDLFGK